MRRLLVFFASGTLAACGSTTSTETELQEAVIHLGGSDAVVLDVPDTVVAFAPFRISLQTYGGGCVRQGFTNVAMLGKLVELRPYDVVTVGAEGCTKELRAFTHGASAQVTDVSMATVRLYGRGLSGTGDTAVVVERRVVVR